MAFILCMHLSMFNLSHTTVIAIMSHPYRVSSIQQYITFYFLTHCSILGQGIRTSLIGKNSVTSLSVSHCTRVVSSEIGAFSCLKACFQSQHQSRMCQQICLDLSCLCLFSCQPEMEESDGGTLSRSPPQAEHRHSLSSESVVARQYCKYNPSPLPETFMFL